MTLQGKELLLSGAWILTIGTIAAAIGQTREMLTGNAAGKDLVIKGSVVEAFGNALQAIGRSKLIEPETVQAETYSILGCWLEAGGNTTNAVGISIEQSVSEEEGLKLDLLGSGIQALGAFFEVLGASLTEESIIRTLEIAGNGLVGSGSLLESIGDIFILNNKPQFGEPLLFFGSWVQVFGALAIVNAFTLDLEPEPYLQADGSKSYRYR